MDDSREVMRSPCWLARLDLPSPDSEPCTALGQTGRDVDQGTHASLRVTAWTSNNPPKSCSPIDHVRHGHASLLCSRSKESFPRHPASIALAQTEPYRQTAARVYTHARKCLNVYHHCVLRFPARPSPLLAAGPSYWPMFSPSMSLRTPTIVSSEAELLCEVSIMPMAADVEVG